MDEPTTAAPAPREQRARAVLRDQRTTDPWFVSRWGVNLYRGCAHGCAYCDGRAEKYRVDGDFERDVVVKTNAPELLAAELARQVEPGFLFVGGGVSDAWQPLEERYRLARATLETALRLDVPVHVLTKSALAERDLDLLHALAQGPGAIVSCSVATLDERVRDHFEPGAAPLRDRWRLLERAAKLGIPTGVMAMPLIPGYSDRPEDVCALLQRARDAGAAFVLAGGMTLRPGAQKRHWLAAVAADPRGRNLVAPYQRLYADDRPSGAPLTRYRDRLDDRLRDAHAQTALPPRIPRALFRGRVPLWVEAAVLLEHEEQAARWRDAPLPSLGKACWALQRWARDRVTTTRRRADFSYHTVEREFLRRLDDGSLVTDAGLPPEAMRFLKALRPTLPDPPTPRQMELL